jgi:hypothetical protein
MLGLAAALVAASALLNYLLNPYGAWRVTLINPVFRKVEHDHLVTPYLLRTVEPETILLGSSRVLMGMRIEQGYRDGVMNAALSAMTMPQAAEVIDVALGNPRLKRIVWGVDFFVFNSRWDRNDRELRDRMAGRFETKLEDTLLSLNALDDGLDLLTRSLRGRRRLAPTMTAGVPWPMGLVCKEFSATLNRGLKMTPHAELMNELSEDVPDYADFELSSRFLALFRREVNKARARGVEVILFVPPMSQYELEEIRQNGEWATFQNFKRELASVGPFWDFSGYNRMARTDTFFMHVMHFKVAVGQEILRIVLRMPIDGCDEPARIVAQSAIQVDPKSIASVLAMQDRMREAATSQESQYSRLAAEAIARRARSRNGVQSQSASAEP